MKKHGYIWLLLVVVLTNCGKDPVESGLPRDDQSISLSADLEKFLIEAKIDDNTIADGQIRYAMIKDIDSLNIEMFGSKLSLKGLEYFTNLKYLKFTGNQERLDVTTGYYYTSMSGINKDYVAPLDTLDVSQNEKLQYLECSGRSDGGGYISAIKYLKLGKNKQLKTLIAQFTMFEDIDLSSAVNLVTLDLSGCYNLPILKICSNPLLWILKSPQVKQLYISPKLVVRPSWQTGSGTVLECK
ncbi:hypothetical protein [Dyadobacter sp. OTU695]|uniref:hypothetical protein n=1 Tax=Dyadobacter sp. OTU695 TaxID=3043860 RepID=UPI00313D2484